MKKLTIIAALAALMISTSAAFAADDNSSFWSRTKTWTVEKVQEVKDTNWTEKIDSAVTKVTATAEIKINKLKYPGLVEKLDDIWVNNGLVLDDESKKKIALSFAELLKEQTEQVPVEMVVKRFSEFEDFVKQK